MLAVPPRTSKCGLIAFPRMLAIDPFSSDHSHYAVGCYLCGNACREQLHGIGP